MKMKKIYIAPETNIYKVNVVSMMATSFGTIEDTPDDNLELSREENTDNTDINRNNIWDNAW